MKKPWVALVASLFVCGICLRDFIRVKNVNDFVGIICGAVLAALCIGIIKGRRGF